MFKLDQTCSNLFKHVQTGSISIFTWRQLGAWATCFFFNFQTFFSDVAANVIPLLMDFLSDSVNYEASAIEVIHFTREAMAKIAHLR